VALRGSKNKRVVCLLLLGGDLVKLDNGKAYFQSKLGAVSGKREVGDAPGGKLCFSFSAFSGSSIERVYRYREHLTLNLVCVLPPATLEGIFFIRASGGGVRRDLGRRGGVDAREASFLCVILMNCLMSRISLGWQHYDGRGISGVRWGGRRRGVGSPSCSLDGGRFRTRCVAVDWALGG